MRAALFLALLAIAAVGASAQTFVGSSTGGPAPAPSTATICDRLTALQNLSPASSVDEQTAVSKLIVRAAVGDATTTGLFTDAITRDYFNGRINYRASSFVPSPFASRTPGYSPDFNTNLGEQEFLVDHLTRFFGAPSALACSAAGFPAYSNSASGFGVFNQYQVHANMNITATVFSAFNAKVVAAAAFYKLSQADQTTINAVLGSFGRNNQVRANVICTQRDCPCATGLVGANCDAASPAQAVQVSFVTLAVAALVAVFAMRR